MVGHQQERTLLGERGTRTRRRVIADDEGPVVEGCAEGTVLRAVADSAAYRQRRVPHDLCINGKVQQHRMMNVLKSAMTLTRDKRARHLGVVTAVDVGPALVVRAVEVLLFIAPHVDGAHDAEATCTLDRVATRPRVSGVSTQRTRWNHDETVRSEPAAMFSPKRPRFGLCA